jgi:hypothetical protein
MPAGNYFQNKCVDWLRGQAFPGAPANTYLTLLSCTKGLRQNSFTYAVNDTITLLANNATRRLYKCTSITTGISAAAQSTLYPGVANEVIVDGGATFTEQDSVLRAVGATWIEPSGGSYARQAMVGALTVWKSTQNDNNASTGTLGQTTNSAPVTFPAAGTDWIPAPGMAWGFALMDALTLGTGNEIVYGYINSPQAIITGNTPSFAAGALVIPFQGNGL